MPNSSARSFLTIVFTSRKKCLAEPHCPWMKTGRTPSIYTWQTYSRFFNAKTVSKLLNNLVTLHGTCHQPKRKKLDDISNSNFNSLSLSGGHCNCDSIKLEERKANILTWLHTHTLGRKLARAKNWCSSVVLEISGQNHCIAALDKLSKKS